MKTIGIIGGLTWHSSLDYYRLINQLVNERKGGVEAASLILYSVNFGEIKKLTEAQNWQGITAIIGEAAIKLEAAGADCLLIGANTMHKIADDIQSLVNIPVIHIAKATAKAISLKNIHTVALLGTKYTMQLDFYKNILGEHGIATIIPANDDIDYINTAIYQEMSIGIFLPETKNRFIQIIESLAAQGAEGVILGCTEIPILIKQPDISIPVFDTTLIHTTAAVDFALV